jgi:hypothetical protein
MHSAPSDGTTDAHPVFQPTWAIYADGAAADLRPVPGSLTGFARWVADALDLLDGLAWLNQPDSAAG